MKKFLAALALTVALITPASANWGCKGESNTGYRTGNWNAPTEQAARDNTVAFCAVREQECTVVCSDGVDTQAQNHERWPLSANQKIFSCRNDPKCEIDKDRQ